VSRAPAYAKRRFVGQHQFVNNFRADVAEEYVRERAFTVPEV
jgi:hypothetical protein